MNVGPELAELSRTIDLGVLGRRIKAARVAAGLTQAQLAAPDVSPAYLSRIESGDRRPELKVLVRFAEKTNVPLEQLLNGITPDRRTALTLDLDYAAVALALGDGRQAMTHLERAREAISGTPTSDLWPQLRLLEARTNRALGHLDEAIIVLEDLLESGMSGPQWLLASIALTQCYLESGDLNRCIESGERLLNALADCGLHKSAEAAEITTSVAAALRARGDDDRAVELCHAALDITTSTVAEQLDEFITASVAERSTADLQMAAAFAGAARARAETARTQAASARFHAYFGELLLAGAQPDIGAARQRFALAATLATQHSSDPVEVASIQLSFAKVLVLEDDFESAAHALPHEETLAGSSVLAASRLLLLSKIERGIRNPRAARDALVESARILTRAQGTRTTAQMWFEIGAMFDEFGDKESAGEAYREAAEATGLAVLERDQESQPAERA